MSVSALPDEVLKRILADYCFISTTQFFSNPNLSLPNFSVSTPNQPGPAILCVSKPFCLIAIQLFYHTVIMSTFKQARALKSSMAMCRSKFSRWTRLIKMEGGHSPPVNDLLNLIALNLEDLCIRLAYMYKPSNDVVTHMLEKGVHDMPQILCCINPLQLGIINKDAHWGSGSKTKWSI